MEAAEQIKKFHQFFEEVYQADLMESVRMGAKSMLIDFGELSKFDHELADMLLEQPEEVIKSADLAVQQFDLPTEAKDFNVRLENLPTSQKVMIKDIRSEHIDKLIAIEGVVRQKSDVRPQVTSARFECPSCGNILAILQLDTQFKEPSRCGCGRKGKFKLISKELIDAQGIVLEEAPENMIGGAQPKRMNIFLKGDLVSPISEVKSSPGSKISIAGVTKEVPIILKSGGKSTRFDLLVEANSLTATEETFYEIEISEKEEKEIKKIAKDKNVFKKIVDSLAPSIYGHEKIKEALLLQLMGGVHKTRSDGAMSRGDMHVLLIGDPGSGKSQMLKRVGVIAPKGRYVSGRGVSGAGLTAAVVKDEFLKGWSLEAGALVLASNGICCIDEMDKMTKEDRSAMHEALEQQSYHPETEILCSSGRLEKIGKIVDSLIDKNKKKVVKGKNCEILNKGVNLNILTTDFKRIYPVEVTKVSRHIAPKHFIEILYSHGRSIKVTPEHPVYVFKDGKIKEIAAEKIKTGQLSPVPRVYPIKTNKNVKLVPQEFTHHNNKKLKFPPILNKDLARLIGYILAEGHSYYNKETRYAEIGVSNCDKEIIKDVYKLFRKVFKTRININIRDKNANSKATKDLTTIRCCSIPLYKFFKDNFNELIHKSTEKRIPNKIRITNPNIQKQLLISAFKGDGFVDTERFGYSTSSFDLAKDYQDILLQNGIWSYISKEQREKKEYFKVTISGTESLKLFYEDCVEKNDKREKKIFKLYLRSKNKLNCRDPILLKIIERCNNLLKLLRISNGYFVNIIKKKGCSQRIVVLKYLNRIKNKVSSCNDIISSDSTRKIRRTLNIQIKDITKKLPISYSTLYNIEKRKDNERYLSLLKVVKNLARSKLDFLESELNNLYKFAKSDIRFIKIKSVRKIPNKNIKWVYDVTVEPTKTFISEGLVLHNTISISKANIQATLLARTTVLAAANPKLGRFDPYDLIANQIDLPPALINRFDLIFPVKDLPDKKKDEMMASHILSLHQQPKKIVPEIKTKLLKKYIAYAKQKIKPKLTNAAMDEIKGYYMKMRASGGAEGDIKTIPISPRQLEALVRLSEASAKVRLSNRVTKNDALRAVELLEYCLMQVGFDKETGKIDIDRITTGIPASQRNAIIMVKEIINELEGTIGKTIPIEDITAMAKEKNIKEEKVEEVIEKLRRSGDIFEPRRGFVSKI